MRIVIAGASSLARALAGHLIRRNHEVVLIDRDAEQLDRLSGDLDCGMIRGDVTHPSTLREALGDGADALLALTGADQDNILSAVVARRVGYPRMLPQIYDPELDAVCAELGLEDVVVPDETIAASLLACLEDGASPRREAPLTGSFRFGDVLVGEAEAGRRIDELDLGEHLRAVSVTRGERDFFAEADTELAAGDRLVVIGRPKALRRARSRFSDGEKG